MFIKFTVKIKKYVTSEYRKYVTRQGRGAVRFLIYVTDFNDFSRQICICNTRNIFAPHTLLIIQKNDMRSLSLSLSLSHTHAHTLTGTVFQSLSHY